jgi:hypothetical protein
VSLRLGDIHAITLRFPLREKLWGRQVFTIVVHLLRFSNQTIGNFTASELLWNQQQTVEHPANISCRTVRDQVGASPCTSRVRVCL